MGGLIIDQVPAPIELGNRGSILLTLDIYSLIRILILLFLTQRSLSTNIIELAT